MIVSDKFKVIYAAPPKTGSSTIRHIMMGDKFEGYISDKQHAHHNTYLIEGKQDYFHFMTVRHPYIRAYSFWRFMCLQSRSDNKLGNFYSDFWASLFPQDKEFPPFSQWLREGPTNTELRSWFFETFRRQWCCSWHRKMLKGLQVHVVHLENFREELSQVPGFEGIGELEKLNTTGTSARPWYEEYEPGDVSRLRALWGRDFKQFGYEHNFFNVKQGKLWI
jgi:hypothetical protein